MSKSDSSENSRVNMTDDADTIARKLRKAKTDPDALPSDVAGLEGRPEAANLLGIFAALSDAPLADVVADQGGRQFSEFKVALTELAVSVLAPIGEEMARLMADPGYLDGVLAGGAERAGAIAAPIMDEVFDVMGILRPGAARQP